MHSKLNSSRPGPQSLLALLLVAAYLLGAHLAAADNQQSVRLPARFGKRAEEPERESGLIKLITDPELNNQNRGRQASADPQAFSSLLSSVLLPPAPSQSAPPPIRYILIPVPMDAHPGKMPYRPSTGADRNGPYW